MRLFEVDNSFVDDLETVLRNLVGRSDSKDASLNLSYDALSSLLQNMGYGNVNYSVFDQMYNTYPALQPLIQNYNDEGIILATRTKDEKHPTGAPDQSQSSEIPAMAARSAKHNLDKKL